MNQEVQRPILRYHGGKWILAPWIISHFPEHKIYVEPFGGAGSVLLRKQRVLRGAGTAKQLCDLLELTPFGRIDFEEAYQPTADLVERARRMVVRSFQGFGSGSFNRDYSTGFRAASKQTGRPHALDWVNIPECLWLVTERLKGVTIENRDGFEVIRQQDHPDALFYLDPPYLETTRPNSNRKQYRFELGITDHYALAKLLRSIKGKAILSGYASVLYDRELYADWRRVEKETQASGQHGRVDRLEVLWMNY
jgi:DNA adenine methylase